MGDDVSTHLGFTVRNPNHKDVPVTVESLYTHTSTLVDSKGDAETYAYGLDNCPFETSLEDFFRGYVSPSGPLSSTFWHTSNWSTDVPGKKTKYSNVGAALAGLLVAKLSGKSFAQFCRERIFVPLGMDSSAWHYKDLGADRLARLATYFHGTTAAGTPSSSWKEEERYCYADYPSGSFMATPADMARFARAMLAYGAIGDSGQRLYSEQVGKLVFKPSSLGSGEFGLGWVVDGNGYQSHSGSEIGISSEIAVDTKAGVAWGIVVSKRDAPYDSLFTLLEDRSLDDKDVDGEAGCPATPCAGAPTTATPVSGGNSNGGDGGGGGDDGDGGDGGDSGDGEGGDGGSGNAGSGGTGTGGNAGTNPGTTNPDAGTGTPASGTVGDPGNAAAHLVPARGALLLIAMLAALVFSTSL